MKLDFCKFNIGTLFLVRTPEVFPVGYADECFADMKRMHFDYVAWLETWNCYDGILWKSDKYPRSSYWKNESRDPIEECFQAADKYDIPFLPEAGVIHDSFIAEHSDAMWTSYDGKTGRFGRVGLNPGCPLTLEFLIEKYDTLIAKFRHHPSLQGICMPCENGITLSYDKYTREAWRKAYDTELPSPEIMWADKRIEQQVFRFLENTFLDMYCKLAKHIKQKHNLKLMHYPLDKISCDSFFQPTDVLPGGNITVMNQVEELDMLNMQIHPPLNPNPYFFKMEAEFLMGNAAGKPCMADTHFYHEFGAGRLPDTTPKRMMDHVLSTLTPYGISFFCYGFMAEQLPLWKKELNIGAPVYKVYDEPHTVSARREMVLKAMDCVDILRPLMESTEHSADCAVYYPESLNNEYLYGSYPVEHIFGLHELFNAAAIPVKIIGYMPEDVTEQKVLVLSSVRMLSKDDSIRLRKYFASGGQLVVIGKCGKEIEEIAGLKISSSDASFVQSEESQDYNHCYIRLPLEGRHYTEANGCPILYYDDGTPAVTKNSNVLYVGVSDEVGRFSQYRDYNLASWWKKYFNVAELNSGVEFHNVYVQEKDRHQFVSCDIFENKDKKLLLVRNYGVEQNKASLTWRLPDDMKIKKAWADGKEFSFENGKNLPLFEHFVAVYAE